MNWTAQETKERRFKSIGKASTNVQDLKESISVADANSVKENVSSLYSSLSVKVKNKHH